MVLIVNDDALITKVELAKQFKEKMKEQERQAIKALIAAKEQLILAKGAELATQLQEAALDMKNYASTNYVKNIKGGFEGKAAQAAETHLTQTMQMPSLDSPIKG
ncbi:hypothetical protein HMPREF9383_1490 [Streptococcus sanguinis SK150]|jgi:hypothetical protein|uniref:Uncharacterized protein n=1 Tax=Streptococcus sanguinis SK150 TaxID=888811 RepID=F0IMY7_STRSA|nr:hypothetical protein [Streptococcus sanguinis]EGD36202.1 hypothetical protein HMPREF9383_1490 [Streptococcus sanguinis SK150]MCY7037717.1 hypothetical protein [Streptococcus sanguinis]RSI06152.1 hypothetical protein D8890_02365 [Streptococcus sanguinis]RSI14590.1 hypothetical protein D8886_10345 [Streptococcus sanguinis]RSI34855.1 hypothetical protein D8876_06805 [Streptococcus sanguinis]